MIGELCGRALTVAPGDPVVCSDCAAELGYDDPPQYCACGRELTGDEIDAGYGQCLACFTGEPGSSSGGTGGRDG